MEYGARKYGDSQNWRQMKPERFRDAAYRRFLSYIDEPDGLDAKSVPPHVYHLACNIAFLIALRREQEVRRMIHPDTDRNKNFALPHALPSYRKAFWFVRHTVQSHAISCRSVAIQLQRLKKNNLIYIRASSRIFLRALADTVLYKK